MNELLKANNLLKDPVQLKNAEEHVDMQLIEIREQTKEIENIQRALIRSKKLKQAKKDLEYLTKFKASLRNDDIRETLIKDSLSIQSKVLISPQNYIVVLAQVTIPEEKLKVGN